MAHDHDGHDHESSAVASNRVKRLVAELERREIVREEDLDRTVEAFLLRASPANAKRAVARSWIDPAFKSRLADDANRALLDIGVDLRHWSPVQVRAVFNTPDEHHVIVCTLCSCYPIALLGPSPIWYKSEAYRSAVVRDPRGVLMQFGLDLPARTKINVWDSTAEVRYLVVPERPAGTEGLGEEALAALVTRDGMIGTAKV